MAAEITVTGGGATAVAPEELVEAGVLLGRLADEVLAITYELASLDRLLSMYSLDLLDAPPAAARAELEIDQAQTVLGQLRAAALTLQFSLQFAADGYVMTEQFIGYLFATGASSAAWLGGFASRLAPVSALVAVGGGVAAASNPQVRGHPVFVSLVREALTQSGDLMAGALGTPLPTALLLGDDGLGVTGLHSAAAMLAGVGSLVGLVRSTPPRLVGIVSQPVDAPPVGAAGRLERILSPTDADGAQVLVERYEFVGEADVFVAYASGTVDFDPRVADEPFDMESNVVNSIDASSASADAVRQALLEAGAGPDSRVQLVGYSQGGASVAHIAASGDFDVRAVLTFGSPTGQIRLDSDVPAVLVEHSDDLVPALGGRQDNADAIVVARRVFDDGEVPTADPVPAHLRGNYADTAQLMDGTADPRLAATLRSFDSQLQNAVSITSTRYEFAREGVKPVG